ncbi:hypothetical protein OK024_03290 [Acinetobacter sp. UGAL515B_02]|nr:hypothetical protein [Acinetobacter sp. UGAL515B_02]WON80822.1 hypothetical protein OK024_03290 [Acinetobacter sp. UGAL515B_02]
MTLKIVNNDLTKEVHLVSIDGSNIEVKNVETGNAVTIANMEKQFPGFKNIIENATDVAGLVGSLQSTNDQFIWAHVSGKL